MQNRADADQLNDHARELESTGDLSRAEEVYKAAASAAPDWSVPFFNLGLLCKYQSRWEESLAYNQRATQLDESDQGAWWNLGIAATALGDWSEARRAWTRCGMQPPAGEGPPDFHFGSTPVRLDPNGDAEVVWSHRIDPARAKILSVPLPSSPHNAHALVLIDGAVDGKRKVGGVEYPVFNVLAILAASPLVKYIVELGTVDQRAIQALERIASQMGGEADNWNRSTRMICADCSRGLPHDHTDSERQAAHAHCGLAARNDEHAEQIIRAWLEQERNADVVRWYDATAGI